MKIATALLVFLIVAGGAACLPANPSITKMGNGLTVILQEDHSAELVGIDVYVKAGSARETAKNNGVSHFIEHLLFTATRKRNPGDMDREIESLGATLDAHTTADYAHFGTTVSSRYLAKALDVFADAMNNSQFRKADVDRERAVICDEIARRQSRPSEVCHDLLAKALYREHPYGLPVVGTRESVASITRDDILDFYNRYYVPSNMAVVLVGDFDTQQAISLIGQLFQGRSEGAAPPRTVGAAVSKPAEQITLSRKIAFDTNYLAIGYLGPVASNYEDVCAMDVLLTYFGIGYRSWLSDQLQNSKGIISSGRADCITQPDPALISIVVAATQPNIAKAKDAILAKIEEIKREGISQPELDRAKRSLLGEFAFQVETVSGRANNYGFYFAVSDAAFAADYVRCVQSVTNEAVKQVARKYLDPDAAAVVMVGPDVEDSR